MSGWNFAEIWEAVADALPDAPAQVQGDRRLTWAEMDRRADGVARALLDAGAGHQDKVAQYLFNRPEYLESVFAAYKAGLVPVNTNYRYTAEELTYLWDNADAFAVVFQGAFTETIDEIRAALPKTKVWLWVDDGTGPCPDWATPYEQAATSAGARTVAPWGRSGDDILMLYTGGTTGMPKGVMWRQDDLFSILNASGLLRYPEEPDYDAVRSMLTQPGPVFLPACPLMHGTGLYTSFGLLDVGGSIALLESHSFDVVEFLDIVEREGVNATAIVGDAFAKPIVRALETEPGRWSIASLFLILSSGVMWSQETKDALLRHHGGMLLLSDQFSSSEALGMGSSVSSSGSTAGTATFRMGENAVVIADDGRLLEPGSGEVGRVGVRGRVPLGYYKDPEKSAATFPTFDGVRYSIPGDYATVDADGTIHLLGRGSVCINTGGEKVYPEEVEEVLKRHPSVHDAVVVGVPDDRWGEAITAWVEPQPGADVDEAVIVAHVKEHLAGYKAPKRVLATATIGRAPNGKVDYKRLRAEAIAALGGDS